jgi:molybdate transport system substrate-binding protein
LFGEPDVAVIRIVLMLFILGQSASALRAAELSFFCTDALAASMKELVPKFEQASGHKVKVTVANAGTIAGRLQAGESPDLAIVLPPAWEQLKNQGRIDQSTRVIIGKVGIGAFARRGSDKLDISTPEAFKRTVLSARRLWAPTCWLYSSGL